MRINYADFYFNAVNKWNAVDVPIRVNGAPQLQHGYAINVLENGVIVDFLCSGRRSEMIEFGQLYDCSKSILMQEDISDPPSHRAFPPNTHVQVLLRPGWDRPWTWYDAKLLDTSFTSQAYGLVELPGEGGVMVTQLVPGCQIRLYPFNLRIPLRLRIPLIQKDYFVIRSCLLPHGYAQPFSNQFWKSLKQHMVKYTHLKIHPVCVVGGTLTYLQQFADETVPDEQMKRSFDFAKADDEGSVPNILGLSASPVNNTDRNLLEEPEEQFTALPALILVEIFQLLETMERVSSRRVCQQWNELLTVPKSFRDVRVSVRHGICPVDPDGCNFPCSCDYVPEHQMAICIFKCLTPATQRIILQDAHYFQVEHLLVQIKDAICYSGHPRDNKLQLIISRSCFEMVDEGIGALASAFTKSAAVFHTLTFKDFTVKYVETGFDTVIPNGELRASSLTMPADLWNLLEKYLPPPNMQKLSKWKPGKKERKDLCRILESYQSLDPRTDNQFHGKEWNNQDLKELDMTKLSRLTLAALNSSIISNDD